MNIIKKIKEQLAQYSINDTLLEFNNNVDSFKKKIFIVPVSVLVLAFWSYIYFSFYLNEFDGTFCLVILCGIFLGFFLHTWVSSFKINGWFFKAFSFLSKSKTLKSFINSANYQDKMILDMFEKSTIGLSVLDFYKTLIRINFSHSEIVNEVYFSNEEIAENLEKIELIMHYNDSKSFLKFFKNKFIFNLSNYSQHPNVIEQVNNEDNNTDNILSIQHSHLPVQDIMATINSHTSLKQKFKAAL